MNRSKYDNHHEQAVIQVVLISELLKRVRRHVLTEE